MKEDPYDSSMANRDHISTNSPTYGDQMERRQYGAGRIRGFWVLYFTPSLKGSRSYLVAPLEHC